MSIIIAHSPSACSSSGGSTSTTTSCLPIQTIQQSIPSGMSLPVDLITTVQALSVKWYVVITTVSGNKSRAFELSCTNVNGLAVDTVYGILGDVMLATMSTSIVAGSYVLTCNNMESEEVIVYLSRLYVPPSQFVQIMTNAVNVEQIHTLVPAGSTTTIDTISTERHVGVKWIITTIDNIKRRSTSQIFSLTDSALCTQYGLLGTNKNIDFFIGLNTHNASLQMQNSTADALSVDVVRIPITPQLPTRCMSASEVAIWIPPHITILPGAQGVADTQISIPGHAGVKWIVVITTGTRRQSFEIVADRFKLTSASHVRYGIIGDRLNIETTVNITGMSFELLIDNYESSAITINTIRVPIAV